MRALVQHVVLILIATGTAGAAAAPATLTSDWTYVAKQLRTAGFEPAFVRALKANYQPANLTKVLELNVLLFLRERDEHGPQANDDGAKRVRDFVGQNSGAFARARRRYGVDADVIASLLYIESRFGQNVGRFHVPSVFLDVVQAPRPAALAHLRGAAPSFRRNVAVGPRDPLRAEIKRRAERKAKWALGELKALRLVWRRDPRALATLKGSFAGAIGMPQFLPSSYHAFARGANAGRAPDLNQTEDAVLSVANYLRASGWRSERPRTHAAALLKYNNSRDYARAILNLAVAASAPAPRAPSATSP